MKLSEYPAWTGNFVALVMTFLTMGVSLGWWGLSEGQLSAVQSFVQQAAPLLIAFYFAAAAWWANRQSIAKKTIERIGVQAAMKQANIK